jgi:hypothetical protein
MADPETIIDHFKIWQVERRETKFNTFLPLKDQFTDREKQKLAGCPVVLEWIANPVEKNGKKILHPEPHLTGWRMKFEPAKPPPPKGHVEIHNQFTSEKGVNWFLGPPQFLLVPAGKGYNPKEPPKDPGQAKVKFDHYLCYEILKPVAVPLPKPVTLMDQFDQKLDKPERIEKIVPRFLGVPVAKGSDSKIFQPDPHLAIYEIDPRTKIPAGKIKITTNDQFGVNRDMAVIESLYLAVPSRKVWHND